MSNKRNRSWLKELRNNLERTTERLSQTTQALLALPPADVKTGRREEAIDLCLLLNVDMQGLACFLHIAKKNETLIKAYLGTLGFPVDQSKAPARATEATPPTEEAAEELFILRQELIRMQTELLCAKQLISCINLNLRLFNEALAHPALSWIKEL